MRLRRRLALVALLSCSTGAAAQSDHAPTCVDSIPASTLAPAVTYLVSTYGDSATPGHAATLRDIDLFAQTASLALRRLLDTNSVQLPPADDQVGWRDLGRHVTVVWRRDGTMAWRESPDTSLRLPTGHRGTALIARALDAMRDAGDAFAGANPFPADSITFELGFHTASRDRNDKVESPKLRLGFPVFTVREPWIEPVSMAGGAGPRYPEEWRQRNYQAELVVQYDVDAHGRADPGTLRDAVPVTRRAPMDATARSAYDDFLAAIRQALPRMRFHPAMIAGCAVPQLVQQPFVFKLAR